jgi:tRNA pseudouridine55 synthase
MNNFQGWLNDYKPVGISSFLVVKKIKKYFNLDKIGHGGTLDPLA